MNLDVNNVNFVSMLTQQAEPKSLNDKSASRDLKLQEQAKEMESLFVSQMIKAMEKTIPDNSITGDKQNLAGMMFSTVFADTIAENNSLGLSELIYNDLKAADNINLDNLKTSVMENPAVIQSLSISGE